MRKKITALVLVLTTMSFHQPPTKVGKLPFREAGLSENQAAAHLLNRFTFGPGPGQVEKVVKMGLEKWLDGQLNASSKDETLNGLLADYDTQHSTNSEIANQYVRNGQVFRMAIKDGFIEKDSVDKSDRKEYQEVLKKYMDSKGLKPEKELVRQTINQKILRATYSENQLTEVLTDFWFNHFNVSFTKNDCSLFIPGYERQSIRPNVLGDFDKLLIATSQSPAMLLYLDNFSSTGENDIQQQREAKRMAKKSNVKPKKVKGLNENYAREVMELHTLGVDGGYTQQDVTEAARILTGWTIYPMGKENYGAAIRKQLDEVGEGKLKQRGFVREGDFLFAPNRHDDREKKVLGKHFPAGRGYEEGVELLEMLAHHTSTAKFITKKIAIRFVSDNPPQSLLDKMAATFTKENGNISKVIMTMVTSKEFWEPGTLREKTKSPFELVVSSIRSLDGKVTQPFQLSNWLNRMGQRIYYYQAPTGFPDKATYWINTGSLLNRMNFGLALSTQKIPGVKFDLLAINNNHEPESAVDALKTYVAIMLPERDLTKTLARLTPLLNDPELQQKVDQAARNNPTQNDQMNKGDEGMEDTLNKRSQKTDNSARYQLSQVVGIILGSPEFQRR